MSCRTNFAAVRISAMGRVLCRLFLGCHSEDRIKALLNVDGPFSIPAFSHVELSGEEIRLHPSALEGTPKVNLVLLFGQDIRIFYEDQTCD